MKKVYPVIIERTDDKSGFGYFVTIPDFDINTEGKDLPDAVYMARDAIGVTGLCYEDAKKLLPEATPIEKVKHKKNAVVTLVDVDFTEYRRKNEKRVVKKNCSLPSWLAFEAEKEHINFSKVLQDALKERLSLD